MSGFVRSSWRLGFQTSPIILVGGLAAGVPGQMLPIIVLTEGASIISGALTGDLPSSLDAFFAQFTPIPSGSLIEQDIAHYPFANQQVAANAVITEPLRIAMRMDCPAKEPGDYVNKLAVLTALQAALSAHNAAGGLYTVATPSFIYVNCILRRLTDISGAQSNQVQYQWLYEFEQPLVTVQAGQQAYGNLLQKIAQGTQLTSAPTWSSIDTSTANVLGGAATSLINGAGQLPGMISGGAQSIGNAIGGIL